MNAEDEDEDGLDLIGDEVLHGERVHPEPSPLEVHHRKALSDCQPEEVVVHHILLLLAVVSVRENAAQQAKDPLVCHSKVVFGFQHRVEVSQLVQDIGEQTQIAELHGEGVSLFLHVIQDVLGYSLVQLLPTEFLGFEAAQFLLNLLKACGSFLTFFSGAS